MTSLAKFLPRSPLGRNATPCFTEFLFGVYCRVVQSSQIENFWLAFASLSDVDLTSLNKVFGLL